MFEILLARVHATLRRRRTPQSEVFQFGECRLDTPSHKLFRNGREVSLTPKEFRRLDYFIRDVDRALTRQKMLDGVWGEDLIVTERSVDRCINPWRNKVEPDPPQPRFTKTIRDLAPA